MNQKAQRFAAIRRIIRNELISSQDDLIARLHASGIEITQSTLSRDLKYLNVAKIPHKSRGYVYVLPNMTHLDIAISPNVADNIVSLTYSGNMGVMKTKPGYASAVSVPIDHLESPLILGTIAGDNTVLLILDEEADRNEVTDALLHLFPALSSILYNEVE